MPFLSGSVSYARFRVTGGPTAVDHDLLAALEGNVLKPPSAGPRPEIQAGWAAPRHLFDTNFNPDAVVIGESLLLGLRIDTNRIPAEVRRAHRVMAETARATESPTGFASRREKRDARDEAEEQCRRELATGRHIKSKLIPILWNVRDRLLFAPIFSDAPSAALRDLMMGSFEASLQSLSSGGLAFELLSGKGLTRDYEDFSPTPFTSPPTNAESSGMGDAATPAVPWSYGGPEPKDFLGNEFLIWLWAHSEMDSAEFETTAGTVALAFDKALDMDCAWDVTGKQTLRADGPTRLPEATKALQGGKWPRKAGLILAANAEQWQLTFQADRFLLTAVKLPKPEESPETEREAIEMRLSSIETLDRAMTGLYRVFLEKRISSAWSTERSRIRKWIAARGTPRRVEPTAPLKFAEAVTA